MVIGCVVLFLLVFGLHQGIEFLINTSPGFVWLRVPSLLIIISIAFYFMKTGGSDLREYGFLFPKKTGRLLAISLLLAVLYALVVIFVPGGMSMFEALPGAEFTWDLLFEIVTILLASIAVETVFRGYVQTRLTSAYGFSITLVVVAAMSTLYMLPLHLYFEASPNLLLYQAVPLLAGSAFGCFFFKETKTLMCTIAFSATATWLTAFTPLRATATEYTTMVSTLLYIFLVPIMQSFVEEVKAQTDRLDLAPIAEPEKGD